MHDINEFYETHSYENSLTFFWEPLDFSTEVYYNIYVGTNQSKKREKKMRKAFTEIEKIALLWREKRRDRDFKKVRDHYFPFMMSLAKNNIGPLEREDVTQILSLALFAAIDSWDEKRCALNTYVGSCFRSYLLDTKDIAWVRNAREGERLIEESDEGVFAEESRDLETNLLLMDLERIQGVTERQRRVVRQLFEDVPRKVIAEKEGVTETTIYWDIQSLRKNEDLRTYLCIR